MHSRGEFGPFMVGFILALAGFVILAISIVPQLLKDDQNSDQACHLSVLARGSIPAGQDSIPLRCVTSKFCITGDSSGVCPQFVGEKNVARVFVDTSNPIAAAHVIEATIAQRMYLCWRMMGEGKLDVFEREGYFDMSRPSCVICSRVAIDVKTVGSIVNTVDLNTYMAETLVPGSSLTYLQAFTDKGIISANSILGESDRGLRSSEVALIFSQIRTRSAWTAAETVFAVGAAGALTPAGTVLTKFPPLAVLYGAGVFAAAGGAAATSLASQSFAAGYCGKIAGSPQGATAGCSLVRPVHWDASKINAFCSGGLEGNLG